MSGLDRALRVGRALWLLTAGVMLVGFFGYLAVYLLWEAVS